MTRHRVVIYLDPITFNEISNRAKDLKVPLSALIRSIIIQWLGLDARPKKEDDEIRELERRRREIEEREHEIAESMKEILSEVKKIAIGRQELIGSDTENVLRQVRNALSLRPLSMRDIINVTSLSETQALIALAHLVDAGEIFLDPDYKYRIRR